MSHQTAQLCSEWLIKRTCLKMSYLPSIHVNFEFLAEVICTLGANASRRSEELV